MSAGFQGSPGRIIPGSPFAQLEDFTIGAKALQVLATEVSKQWTENAQERLNVAESVLDRLVCDLSQEQDLVVL